VVLLRMGMRLEPRAEMGRHVYWRRCKQHTLSYKVKRFQSALRSQAAAVIERVNMVEKEACFRHGLPFLLRARSAVQLCLCRAVGCGGGQRAKRSASACSGHQHGTTSSREFVTPKRVCWSKQGRIATSSGRGALNSFSQSPEPSSARR
jgi:hypothetical protein